MQESRFLSSRRLRSNLFVKLQMMVLVEPRKIKRQTPPLIRLSKLNSNLHSILQQGVNSSL